MVVMASKVDQAPRKPALHVAQEVVPIWVLDEPLVDSKSLLIILRRGMGLYLEGKDFSTAFLKTGHTLDSFHGLGKNLSFKERLNNLARTGYNSGLIF